MPFCELFAPSAPITPFTFPCPNFSFGLDATVEPYANQSAIAPPRPGNSPMNEPISPPRILSFQDMNTSLIPCVICFHVPLYNIQHH